VFNNKSAFHDTAFTFHRSAPPGATENGVDSQLRQLNGFGVTRFAAPQVPKTS